MVVEDGGGGGGESGVFDVEVKMWRFTCCVKGGHLYTDIRISDIGRET